MKKKLNEKSTLMARMGFKDKDIKLKSHDDIILWLYNKKTLITILEKYYISKEGVEEIKRKRLYTWKEYLKKFDENFNKETKKLEELRKELPMIIRSKHSQWYKSQYKESFERRKKQIEEEKKMRDLMVPKITEHLEHFQYIIKVFFQEGDIEYIIKNEKGYEIGFVDLHIKAKIYTPDFNGFEITHFTTSIDLIFEVKTRWDSLGVLMRQLNLYKQNLPGGPKVCFLVAPPNNNIPNISEILNANGWIFIEIPKELLDNIQKQEYNNLERFIR